MYVYLLVEEITGVGQEPREDWARVKECTFGFQRGDPATEGADQSDESNIRTVSRPITITRASDRATPSLVAWMDKGDARAVTVEYSLTPSTLYLLKFELAGARLRTYQAALDGDAGGVTETLSIDYEAIQLTYWQQGLTNTDLDVADFELASGA